MSQLRTKLINSPHAIYIAESTQDVVTGNSFVILLLTECFCSDPPRRLGDFFFSSSSVK